MWIDFACKEWTGARNWAGYGYRGYPPMGKNQKVHRIAWMEAHGPIPDGLLVCHRCDNPPCYEIEHLFLGTHADNTQDAIQKGRHPGWANHHYHGEDHPRAVLTQELVDEIRQRYIPRVVNQRLLADEYGVSRSTIQRVVNNQVYGSR